MRPVLGVERMTLQGFHWSRIRDLNAWDDSQLCNLAGYAFSGHVLAVILLSCLAHVPVRLSVRRSALKAKGHAVPNVLVLTRSNFVASWWTISYGVIQ